MMKMQCWEFKKCGREPGGSNVSTLGTCKAATETYFNGINGGINGGRSCWAIKGTLCDGRVAGAFAEKCSVCLNCDFMKMVRREEGTNARIFINEIIA